MRFIIQALFHFQFLLLSCSAIVCSGLEYDVLNFDQKKAQVRVMAQEGLGRTEQFEVLDVIRSNPAKYVPLFSHAYKASLSPIKSIPPIIAHEKVQLKLKNDAEELVLEALDTSKSEKAYGRCSTISVDKERSITLIEYVYFVGST